MGTVDVKLLHVFPNLAISGRIVHSSGPWAVRAMT